MDKNDFFIHQKGNLMGWAAYIEISVCEEILYFGQIVVTGEHIFDTATSQTCKLSVNFKYQLSSVCQNARAVYSIWIWADDTYFVGKIYTL